MAIHYTEGMRDKLIDQFASPDEEMKKIVLKVRRARVCMCVAYCCCCCMCVCVCLRERESNDSMR